MDSVEGLIAAHRGRGDLAAAADAAVRHYGPGILGFLVSLMESEAEGYEVFSRFCEDMWRGIDSYRGEGSFRAWAYRVAWAAAKRRKRDHARRRERALGSEEQELLVAEPRPSTARHLRTTSKNSLAALRRQLPEEDQLLLVLRVDRSMRWREIADVLADQGEAVSEQALWKRFERVKARLRDLAAEAGLLPGEDA